MTSGPLADFLKHLRSASGVRAVEGRTDAELLERFVTWREEAAFEALVRRHGPMVLSVCRHLLFHVHDVEDAFQATLLVFVSKAASIRRPTLMANWLYRVTYRVAMRARLSAARRLAHERPGVETAAAVPDADGIAPELYPLLHEELNRLPEKYRAPIALCYLQGKTHEEAARQLVWPIGTVKGRLARARDLLRTRLTRRGVTLTTGVLAAILTRQTASAAVPVALLDSTFKAAMLFAAGQAAMTGMLSAQAAALCRGVLRAMFLTKITVACTVLLAVGAIGASTGLFAYQKFTTPATEPQQAAKADEGKSEPKKQDEKAQKAARQRSANNMQALMAAMHKYHEVNDHFPPVAIYDKDGKALLSWRVLLLPYLEQDDLFAQFHLDEPWDSKHNKPLLAKMPKRYAPPVRGKTKEMNATFYQVFAGKGTIFDGAEGVSITDIADGTSNTIAFVEAVEAVPWTKPADLPYDAKKPLPKVGGLFDRGFHAAFADGSIHWLKKDFDVPTMHLAITCNDGFPLNFDKLKADK